MKTTLLTLTLVAAGIPAAFGFSSGPQIRRTGAPGDTLCTACHGGTPVNGGPGSVKIILPGGTFYTPGVKQHIKVTVSDPDQARWGFELTARLNSNLSGGRGGDLLVSDAVNTQIKCDTAGTVAPCNAGDVQFIEHTRPGTAAGQKVGNTFEFDWMPPAAGAGSVTLYVAGNAANNDGNLTGDRIYTSSVQLDVAPALPTTKYSMNKLTSDIPGFAANTDPNLVNPWGIAMTATSPFWISNNRSQSSTLYNGAGVLFPTTGPLVVKNVSSATGQVANTTQAFPVQPGKPAGFIFSTEDGKIIGWNGTVDRNNGQVLVDNSGNGAVYKGLALGANPSGPVLFAANFASGTVDSFDATNKQFTTAGGFQDPNLPAGFAPFNVQRIGRSLYVSYAMQNDSKSDDVAGAGNGYINVFDMDGNLRKRLVAGGALNSPWGMTIASNFFGDYSGTLLVGNFGDGTINAYDPFTGDWLGTIQDATGNALTIPGLWALTMGAGSTNGGDANTLYFTAGIAGDGKVEDHGLFGSIVIAPAN